MKSQLYAWRCHNVARYLHFNKYLEHIAAGRSSYETFAFSGWIYCKFRVRTGRGRSSISMASQSSSPDDKYAVHDVGH
jgi:hypothetical protein